jgi:DNA-binding protein H-NS
MAAAGNLKSMSIDKLMKLKSQVEGALATKVADERRTLEAELGKLSHFASGGSHAKGRRGASGKVAPKYRNPENPAETWAGRGLKPRWLAAAIKAGKKLEHFSIALAGKKAPKKTRKTKIKTVPKVRPKKTRSPRAVRPRLAPASSPSSAGAGQT